MSRGKLNLNLISNHKSRTSMFQKRKKSLMKKAYELSTLCDVRTCVLIHGPAPEQRDDRSGVEFSTWPPNRNNEIEGTICAYKTKLLQKGNMKCFNLKDFFSDRKSKIETETCKLLKNVDEIKYPKWDERLVWLSEDELKVFVDDLVSKIDVAERIIDFMDADYDHKIEERGSTIDVAELYEEQPQNLLIEGNLVLMIPMEEFDFSDFLIELNEYHSTYKHLQSLLEDDTVQKHNQLDYGHFEYFDDDLNFH